jgi:hypothetical protein
VANIFGDRRAYFFSQCYPSDSGLCEEVHLHRGSSLIELKRHYLSGSQVASFPPALSNIWWSRSATSLGPRPSRLQVHGQNIPRIKTWVPVAQRCH